VGLAAKHASDSSDETSDETTCRNMPGLLAAVVGLGRGRLASRGKQVGCQLRGKLPANAAAAAMSTSGVARFQKAADHLSSQSTEGAAPVRSAATMWFTAEGTIERASEERPKRPIPVCTTGTSGPFGRSILSRVHRLKPAVGISRRLAAVGMHDDLGAVHFLGGAVGVFSARSRGAAATHRRGLGGSVPLRCARRELNEVVLPGRGVPLGDPACGKRRGREGRPVAVGGGGARHGEVLVGYCSLERREMRLWRRVDQKESWSFSTSLRSAVVCRGVSDK